MSSGPEDWYQKLRARSAADAQGWVQCSGLNKWEAEELLDWLEANGYAQRELSFAAEQGFTIRWRR